MSADLKPHRLMSPDEMLAVDNMRFVRYLPASFEKRFMRNISNGDVITDKQAPHLWRLFFRYRKQVPNFPDKQRLLQFAAIEAAKIGK